MFLEALSDFCYVKKAKGKQYWGKWRGGKEDDGCEKREDNTDGKTGGEKGQGAEIFVDCSTFHNLCIFIQLCAADGLDLFCV